MSIKKLLQILLAINGSIAGMILWLMDHGLVLEWR